MRIKILPAIFFLLIGFISMGQDTANAISKFDQRGIFHYGGNYLQNGEKLNKSELRSLLNSYPSTAVEYKSFTKKVTIGKISSFGSLAFIIAGITQRDNNRGLSNGFLIAGISGNLISLPISFSAKKHLQKSIWLYNREVVR